MRDVSRCKLFARDEATRVLLLGTICTNGRLTEGDVATAAPLIQLTKQDLIDHLRTGCKPEAQWRCADSKPYLRCCVSQQCLHAANARVCACVTGVFIARLAHCPVSVGTEHEKLATRVGSRERATYEDIAPILRGLVERHGWDAKMQGDGIFGALVRPCSEGIPTASTVSIVMRDTVEWLNRYAEQPGTP